MTGWALPLIGCLAVLILGCALSVLWPKRRTFISNRAIHAMRITRTMPDNWLRDFKSRTYDK